MHAESILVGLRTAIDNQLALGAADPAVEAASERLLDALAPAIRQAVLELAQQAAVEVGAQLPDRSVDVVISGDDIELRVVEAPVDVDPADGEDFDARITLRLPPTLKSKVEQFATVDGESVNAWVVDALNRGIRRQGASGGSVTEEFDL